MSSDDNWVLYYDPPGINNWNERVRIASVPLASGPTETVMEEQGLYVFRCTRPPASRCIAGVLNPKELLVHALDPIKGPGPELFRISGQCGCGAPNLDQSPDGTSIAFISLNYVCREDPDLSARRFAALRGRKGLEQSQSHQCRRQRLVCFQ